MDTSGQKEQRKAENNMEKINWVRLAEVQQTGLSWNQLEAGEDGDPWWTTHVPMGTQGFKKKSFFK